MTYRSYQYHVYNEHLSLLVSVPLDNPEYAEGFAKRTAMDFYNYSADQLENVEVEFITSYRTESVINIQMLNEK